MANIYRKHFVLYYAIVNDKPINYMICPREDREKNNEALMQHIYDQGGDTNLHIRCRKMKPKSNIIVAPEYLMYMANECYIHEKQEIMWVLDESNMPLDNVIWFGTEYTIVHNIRGPTFHTHGEMSIPSISDLRTHILIRDTCVKHNITEYISGKYLLKYTMTTDNVFHEHDMELLMSYFMNMSLYHNAFDDIMKKYGIEYKLTDYSLHDPC